MTLPSISSRARNATALLPVAFVAHAAEEWLGGFSAWTATALGREVSPGRFLLINLVALPVFVICSAVSQRNSRFLWLSASLATLFGLNGALHTLATLAFWRYSPGVATAVLLYLPLSAIVLRATAERLPSHLLGRGVAVGVIAHAAVAALAFM